MPNFAKFPCIFTEKAPLAVHIVFVFHLYFLI